MKSWANFIGNPILGNTSSDRAQPKIFLNSSFGIGERRLLSPWGTMMLFQPGKIFKPWLSLPSPSPSQIWDAAIQIHLTYLVPGCCLSHWPVIQQTKMWAKIPIETCTGNVSFGSSPVAQHDMGVPYLGQSGFVACYFPKGRDEEVSFGERDVYV